MTSIFIPIRLRSTANISEHWAKRSARQKKEKFLVRHFLSPYDLKNTKTITLIRHAPRKLDEDNLAYAFKHIRDCIADLIIPGMAPGRADANLIFICNQVKSKIYQIEISFTLGI